jgi:hypothetical protein
MNRVTLSVVYKGLGLSIICIGLLATLLRDSGFVPESVTGDSVPVVMLVLLLGMIVAYALDIYNSKHI